MRSNGKRPRRCPCRRLLFQGPHDAGNSFVEISAGAARMNSSFEFQYPWLLALLALLPLYMFLCGRVGPSSSLAFSSAELVRTLGDRVRTSAGRLLVFLRLLTVALAIAALAGPRR